MKRKSRCDDCLSKCMTWAQLLFDPYVKEEQNRALKTILTLSPRTHCCKGPQGRTHGSHLPSTTMSTSSAGSCLSLFFESCNVRFPFCLSFPNTPYMQRSTQTTGFVQLASVLWRFYIYESLLQYLGWFIFAHEHDVYISLYCLWHMKFLSGPLAMLSYWREIYFTTYQWYEFVISCWCHSHTHLMGKTERGSTWANLFVWTLEYSWGRMNPVADGFSVFSSRSLCAKEAKSNLNRRDNPLPIQIWIGRGFLPHGFPPIPYPPNQLLGLFGSNRIWKNWRD